MPSTESGGVKNMWYSFDYASLHFTSISSETDFPDAPENSFMGENLNGHFGNQLQWLEADLKAANANRDAVPWLIVGMHRAMYTLNAVDGDGNPTGVSSALQRAFEALFLRYKVDVVVAGHVHAYERHFPIAKGKKIADGVSSDGKTYTAPKAPVYLVTGAAGNSEGHDQFHNATQVEWVAVSDRAHYGISSLKTTRGSLTFTLIGTHDDVVYDEFVVTKG
ncbi:Calcineurin-like phosphoesterase, partial [Globisporangium splendens]